MSTVVSDSIRRPAEPPREPRVHRDPSRDRGIRVKLEVELTLATPAEAACRTSLVRNVARLLILAGQEDRARPSTLNLGAIRGCAVRDPETGFTCDSGD